MIKAGQDESKVFSVNPYSGETGWEHPATTEAEIEGMFASARRAQRDWARAPHASRIAVVKAFADVVERRADELAHLISYEAGKPRWEAAVEVNSLRTKLPASVEAFEARSVGFSREVRGMTSRTRFLPHGVFAVLGPFNFPASMPNSHIMPALLAGNAVVFKPSELTPRTGQLMAEMWAEAGLPAGLLCVAFGGRHVGETLVHHRGHDGVLFIGSHAAGLKILEALAGQPDKLVALEMGGNSPLVVWDYDDLDAAVHTIVQSTFVTGGQRCTAARRLIVQEGDDRLIGRLAEVLQSVQVGSYESDPEPFYGPLIRPSAAARVLDRQRELTAGGGVPLLEAEVSGPWQTLVSPGLIDVTTAENDRDEEIFGPMLKVYRVPTLEEAVRRCNATVFGLAAGIVCRSEDVFASFALDVKAGIVNWNQQLTGATAFAPFGGVKQSGNSRSAGYVSADYCSYPIASFELPAPRFPDTLNPGLSFPNHKG